MLDCSSACIMSSTTIQNLCSAEYGLCYKMWFVRACYLRDSHKIGTNKSTRAFFYSFYTYISIQSIPRLNFPSRRARVAAGIVQCLWKYDMKIFRENVFRFPSAQVRYTFVLHTIDFIEIMYVYECARATTVCSLFRVLN